GGDRADDLQWRLDGKRGAEAGARRLGFAHAASGKAAILTHPQFPKRHRSAPPCRLSTSKKTRVRVTCRQKHPPLFQARLCTGPASHCVSSKPPCRCAAQIPGTRDPDGPCVT